MTKLSGATFFKLAFRMTAYQSVMRERVAVLLNRRHYAVAVPFRMHDLT